MNIKKWNPQTMVSLLLTTYLYSIDYSAETKQELHMKKLAHPFFTIFISAQKDRGEKK